MTDRTRVPAPGWIKDKQLKLGLDLKGPAQILQRLIEIADLLVAPAEIHPRGHLASRVTCSLRELNAAAVIVDRLRPMLLAARDIAESAVRDGEHPRLSSGGSAVDGFARNCSGCRDHQLYFFSTNTYCVSDSWMAYQD